MKRLPFLILMLLWLVPIFGQSQDYTPLDDLPGLCRPCKPPYSPDYPDWAKWLYKEDVNVWQATKDFDRYMANHRGEKSALTRYFKMWRKAVEPYVDETGRVVMPDLVADRSRLLDLQTSAQPGGKGPATNGSSWTFLGPKETFWLNADNQSTPPSACPWQVNVYSFDVAPSDPAILYTGTETGLVNKSTDNGLHWNLMASHYPFGGGVTSVAVHPTNPDQVLVAAGNQVHKTTDGGATWTPLLPFSSQFASDKLVYNPQNPQQVLAASSNGLHRTTDGGTGWTNSWPVLTYDVDYMPGNPSVCFGIGRTGGVFVLGISVDSGLTFAPDPGFPTGIADQDGAVLAVTPANPDLLFVLLLSSNNTPLLYKGTHNAGSWTWSLLATGNTAAFPMTNGQGFFDLALGVSPVDPSLILAGTTTLYRSVDGGLSFNAVGGYSGNFPIHPDIQDLKILPNGETWVATDGGMNRTTDFFTSNANHQARVEGLIGSDFWGFDQGWNEDLVVGGRYHNGNTAIAGFYQPKALRMGGAESPTGWVLQGKSRHVAFDDLGNGWILPASPEGPPEGRFLFTKYPNMEEYGGRRGNLVHHPNYYEVLFTGEGTGFWKSSDMGQTWELLHTFANTLRFLQISSVNPDVLYADVLGYGLFRSGDGGHTWSPKPSLCQSPNGSAAWRGKLFFVLSPYNEDVLYACLQNGMWSADVGKVFRSVNGGDSWENYSGSISTTLKCMAIQPTTDQKDLVYLFSTSRNGNAARVWYRKEGMSDWEAFDTQYPAGMSVNMALPFFRDSRLRVAGSAGVWESPLQEPAFTPLIIPWVDKPVNNCMDDTLLFDDHSFLNHAGATWHWDIQPAPAFVSDANIRNPRVVLGQPGAFTVTLAVTVGGLTYSKTIDSMVVTRSCPSVEDCTNPGEISKTNWSLVHFDSQEVNDPGLATMSFDDDYSTIWHTRWSTGDDPYPHEISVSLGQAYKVYRFTYYTRQDGENGRIKAYELYLSLDSLNWGSPVATGQWINTSAPQSLDFPAGINARFFRLVALSEVNGNPWASAAEFSLVGCTDLEYNRMAGPEITALRAFPVPGDGVFHLELNRGGLWHWEAFSQTGATVAGGTLTADEGARLDLRHLPAGFYLVRLSDREGRVYQLKLVRN